MMHCWIRHTTDTNGTQHTALTFSDRPKKKCAVLFCSFKRSLWQQCEQSLTPSKISARGYIVNNICRLCNRWRSSGVTQQWHNIPCSCDRDPITGLSGHCSHLQNLTTEASDWRTISQVINNISLPGELEVRQQERWVQVILMQSQSVFLGKHL